MNLTKEELERLSDLLSKLDRKRDVLSDFLEEYSTNPRIYNNFGDVESVLYELGIIQRKLMELFEVKEITTEKGDIVSQEDLPQGEI